MSLQSATARYLQVKAFILERIAAGALRAGERVPSENELTRARPGYSLLFEESGAEKGSDPHHRWIVDPLDGTTNFLHGIPHFAISIALERDGEIVAGLVYDPVRDEMYSAEKGLGAYVNDRRLRVSARRRLAEAVIGTGMPFGDRGDRPVYLASLAAVMAATSGVRRIGAAALDPVSGRLLGFVLSRLAADEAEILTIAVDAAHQGRGVGRALLSENLRQAANAGAKAMFLEVAKDNGAALALYERFGFVKVGERAGYYRRADGTRATAIVMRKALG